MFGRKRRRRRSEMRLGVQSISYETKKSKSTFSLKPVVRFWRERGATVTGWILLLLLGWLFYVLFTDPIFFISGAEITGNEAVSIREIYQAGGIDRQSVFWINPAEVAERVMQLPNIKTASVRVSLPARLSIEVVERRPELLWQTDETIWWVDEEGTIVPPKGDVSDMPRIIDDDRQPVEAGYHIDPTIIQGAQTLRMLAPDVSVIRYSRAQGLTVATPEGWPVYLGDGRRIKTKLVVLTAVLVDLKERNITPQFIDLQDPLRPFYKPRKIIRIGELVVDEPQPTPNFLPRP